MNSSPHDRIYAEIDDENRATQDDLCGAGQPGGVDPESNIVVDEAPFIAHASSEHAQALFERSQRADPAGELDEDPPHGRWDMRPSEPGPTEYQKASDRNEQHKGEMQEQDRIRKYPIVHGNRTLPVASQKPIESAPRAIRPADARSMRSGPLPSQL